MINVAIDGPAGAGKSTVARGAAKKLGYIYVDTGALYRTVALAATRNGVLESAEKTEQMLKDITVDLAFDDAGAQCVYLNGEDVSSLIRTPEISMAASNVSKIPAVRAFLLGLQRDIAAKNNVIMDGRDIGTHVLPNADVKIFLTADAHVRALRRYEEFTAKGINCTLENVEREVIERDERDMNRAIAPLKQAEDAVRVDTSQMNIDEVVNCLRQLILDRI